MNTVVAVLDFLLLVATLRLVAWPLVNQSRAAWPRSDSPVHARTVTSASTRSPGMAPASGGQATGTLVPERSTELLDRLEQEVSGRKAMLVQVNCPACGQLVTARDRFCRSCGDKLSTQDGEV